MTVLNSYRFIVRSDTQRRSSGIATSTYSTAFCLLPPSTCASIARSAGYRLL